MINKKTSERERERKKTGLVYHLYHLIKKIFLSLSKLSRASEERLLFISTVYYTLV